MRRRFVLASTLLGALSATALAWAADSVITIPLAPPPKAKAEETKTPKPDDKKTTTVAVAPAAEPMSPQAIVTIPAPEFSTEPLFAPGLDLDEGAFPLPDVDPALIEGKKVEPKAVEPKALATPPKERLEARPQPAPLPMPRSAPPPMPQPKPLALKEQTAAVSTAPAEPAKPRRGVMEPIDDYRPPKRPSVVIDPTALDRSLSSGSDKPAKTPLPQPKPATPKPKAEAKILAKGEMEPIDDIPGPRALKTKPGEASTFRCFVRDVMAFYDRTHIRCYNKAKSKLNFFAVDTGQPISASVVSKGLAAMQAGKPATITFAPESDLNPSNCAAANCRRLIDIQN
jgi:hypothetical protein